MRNLTHEQAQQLKDLAERNLFIMDYLIADFNRLNIPDSLNLLQQSRAIIEETYRNNNIRGMKILANDLSEQASGLPRHQIEELNQQLELKNLKPLIKEPKF